ncbi:MAG: SGNH/GDSL hydrolase family protein [Saprospiraceae bacterium]|nr:SGNH/GDSL hydrolase family protein [Saprospiraceae bacterium]
MFYKLLLLLLLPFLTANCTEKEPKTDIEPPKMLTYLALGDSYTIGQSVKEEERYPVQLAEKLRPLGHDINHVRIIAKTGWTTDELAAGIASSNLTTDSTYDLVSLLIGVNNQYRSRPVESYKPEFTELLNQAIAFAGGRKERVFVVSIPDYAYTPFGNGRTDISEGIDAYNAANREISEGMGIRYFDITPTSRQGLDDPTLVASDGLHPSGKQYAIWVNGMVEGVKDMLGK